MRAAARIVLTLLALCVCKGAFAQDPRGASQNPDDLANAILWCGVNLDAARKAGLKSSAKLLALARTVLGAPKGT